MKLYGVTKRYGEITALNGISAEIEEGKITAVLGESGAGKTTLLNVLAGLTPFEGEIEGGKRKYSYLFQSARLLPNLTAEGNLRFVLPRSEWGEIPKALGRVGLEGKEKRYPHELSGGEAQRVAIARAYLYPHDLLLMDEPFSSLDLSLKASLLSLTAQLWAERKDTVVFVTHDVREAALLSHRALVLKGGEIVSDIPVEDEFPRDFFRPPQAEEALVRALTGEPRPDDGKLP